MGAEGRASSAPALKPGKPAGSEEGGAKGTYAGRGGSHGHPGHTTPRNVPQENFWKTLPCEPPSLPPASCCPQLSAFHIVPAGFSSSTTLPVNIACTPAPLFVHTKTLDTAPPPTALASSLPSADSKASLNKLLVLYLNPVYAPGIECKHKVEAAHCFILIQHLLT